MHSPISGNIVLKLVRDVGTCPLHQPKRVSSSWSAAEIDSTCPARNRQQAAIAALGSPRCSTRSQHGQHTRSPSKCQCLRPGSRRQTMHRPDRWPNGSFGNVLIPCPCMFGNLRQLHGEQSRRAILPLPTPAFAAASSARRSTPPTNGPTATSSRTALRWQSSSRALAQRGHRTPSRCLLILTASLRPRFNVLLLLNRVIDCIARAS